MSISWVRSLLPPQMVEVLPFPRCRLGHCAWIYSWTLLLCIHHLATGFWKFWREKKTNLCNLNKSFRKMNNSFAKRAYVDHFVCIKRIYCRQGYFSPRGFFRHILHLQTVSSHQVNSPIHRCVCMIDTLSNYKVFIPGCSIYVIRDIHCLSGFRPWKIYSLHWRTKYITAYKSIYMWNRLRADGICNNEKLMQCLLIIVGMWNVSYTDKNNDTLK